MARRRGAKDADAEDGPSTVPSVTPEEQAAAAEAAEDPDGEAPDVEPEEPSEEEPEAKIPDLAQQLRQAGGVKALKPITYVSRDGKIRQVDTGAVIEDMPDEVALNALERGLVELL